VAGPSANHPPLSLHDALPIWAGVPPVALLLVRAVRHEGLVRLAHLRRRRQETAEFVPGTAPRAGQPPVLGGGLPEREGEGEQPRSEEHTSELQSRENLVCRLL